MALGTLANVYSETGRTDEAERTHAQALAIHRQTTNRRIEGAHTCDYALLLLALKRADAREVWRTGAEILKEVGDMALLETQTAEMREACATAGVPPFADSRRDASPRPPGRAPSAAAPPARLPA